VQNQRVFFLFLFFYGRVAEGHQPYIFTKMNGQHKNWGVFYIYVKMAFAFSCFVFCLFDCDIEYSNMNAEAQNRRLQPRPNYIKNKTKTKNIIMMHWCLLLYNRKKITKMSKAINYKKPVGLWAFGSLSADASQLTSHCF